MERTQSEWEVMARHAKEIYAAQIQADVETEENTGKIITIDLDTATYVMSADYRAAVRYLHTEPKSANTYSLRIGYHAVNPKGVIVEPKKEGAAESEPLEWSSGEYPETRRIGLELYEAEIREQVDTPENWDKFIVIDTRIGGYTISDYDPTTMRRVGEESPTARYYVVRVGYNKARRLGEWFERPRRIVGLSGESTRERGRTELTFPNGEPLNE